MNLQMSLVLLLMMMGLFLFALFYIVRTAVKEGMQMALRKDLLDLRALDGSDAR